MSQRELRLGERTAQYNPSKTELFLETICESFETELLPGEVNDINGTKLVRVSKPVVISENNRDQVIQFQHTRFSPLVHRRWLEVYNTNSSRSKRKISSESAWDEIERDHRPWDAIKEVTNEGYINKLKLHRFPKGIYVAVYDIGGKILKGLEPFYVHEPELLKNILPSIHIQLNIEPFFVIREMREKTNEIYDSLRISFPRIDREHKRGIEATLNSNPLNILSSPEIAFEKDESVMAHYYKIHSSVQRELTMGFIRNYLMKFCLDKDF